MMYASVIRPHKDLYCCRVLAQLPKKIASHSEIRCITRHTHQNRCKIFFLRNSAYDLSYSGVKPFVAALLLQKEPAAL